MATSRPPVNFSDEPHSELERSISDVIVTSQRVLRTQQQLRKLLEANQLVVEGLDLEDLLKRIAEAAAMLTGAQYAALGVLAPDSGLEQFVHVGMAADDVAKLPHPPHGEGLLGAVIDVGEPIRLDHITDDSRSAGFPAQHPEMDSFLGVPIRVHGEVFGNLYLTNPPGGGPFTEEDEELVEALAATAAIAIENARLFHDVAQRERRSAALAEVTSALLSDEAADPLAIIADRLAVLVDAHLVSVVVPVGDGALIVDAARGDGADQVSGHVFSADGSLSQRALDSGQAVALDDPIASSSEGGTVRGPSVAVPLTSPRGPIGVFVLTRNAGSARFAEADVALAAEFAAQASVAIELASGRADRARLELVEDRSRIARDLHDHVIQRLFGAGLELQAASATVNASAQHKVQDAIDAIDAAIREIRTAVFALSSPATRTVTLRHRVLDAAADLADTLGMSPRLSFVGAVDTLVDGALGDDVVAVVRESLANIARHARATVCTVEVSADELTVRVRVTDDGIGYAEGPRRSGTANLAERARHRGGEYLIVAQPTGGTAVDWSVPLARQEESA